MDWFVLSHSLKLIALKCYDVAFHMSNILQTISIPKAAFSGGWRSGRGGGEGTHVIL